MTSPEPFDPQNSYPEIEIEVEPNDSPNLDASDRFSRWITIARNWYDGLPVPARVGIAVLGFFVTLSVLTAILRLVSAVLSVLILVVILYLLYRFVIKPKSSQ